MLNQEVVIAPADMPERDANGNRQVWFSTASGETVRLTGAVKLGYFCCYCGRDNCVAVTHGESVCG